MPTPNPTTRREYKGAAAATTLQNPMTNSDTSFVLVAANNWPTGAVGKFVVCINRGQADEEKILCDTQSSRTVACLLANRGFDGTTAQAHAAGATVECTISAFDADEWNQHTNATGAVHGVAGSVVGTTDTQTLTNKTLTSPTVNGGTLDATSTIGGVSGTSLAADRTAWTSYTPTYTNFTLGNGTVSFKYIQSGKKVHFHFIITVGSTSSASGSISFTLPVTAVTPHQYAAVRAFDGVSGYFMGNANLSGGSAIIELPFSATNGALANWSGPICGVALTAGQTIESTGTYEAA